MTTRFLIPSLCIGAVVFACGPRAHSDSSSPRKDTPLAVAAVAPVIQQGSTGAPRTPKSPFDAQLFVRTNESSITFALHVVNMSKRSIELTFPTGQTHDFVVVDSTGREVWRWGRGRMFTQTLRNKMLRRGDTMNVEESIASSALPPGRYIARGLITSQNHPLVQEAEFAIAASSSLASR